MLLLLFVPFAWYFKGYADRPNITYIEDKDLFWEDGMTELDFLKKPDGSPLVRFQNIDLAFQDIGVTFAYGLPLRAAESEAAPGLVQAIHLKSESEKEKENLAVPKKAYRLSAAKDNPSSKPKDLNAAKKPKLNSTGNIGVSGYPFRYSHARYKSSICAIDTTGTYGRRFKGSITIRFHKPEKPEQIAGVHAIGFYAARLNHPEALEVRAYNLDGELLCRQKNIADRRCAFMSLKSKTAISRIEIQTIGMDEDYAIAGVMFDKVRSPSVKP